MTDESMNFLFGSFIGLLAWFFGGLDGFFKLLISLTVIDYVLGTFLAWNYGQLSSKVGFQGIFKKCIMFSFVGIANLIDKYLASALTGGSAIRVVVCLFYIGNEGVSIIENADKIGIPIPLFLRQRFLELREKNHKQISEKNNDQENIPEQKKSK